MGHDRLKNISSAEEHCVASTSHNRSQHQSSSSEDYEQSVRQSLDTSMETFGCSPMKMVGKRDRKTYGKRKLMTFQAAVKSKVAKVLDVSQTTFSDSSSDSSRECKRCERLLDLMKDKCQSATKREKMKILTLCPEDWSVRKVASEFGVSRHLASRSKLLRAEKGILGEPECETRKGVGPEIEQRVVAIYQSDEYSRMCPGKKDFVTVRFSGNRTQMQKRLLLINLKELYIDFVKATGDKIGFSKFCSLRPKWCVPVTSAGMHSVCVCELHQNAKLLLTAIPSQMDYKSLLEKLVCSTENRDCMLHRCSSCPGPDKLRDFLMELFSEEDYDPVNTVTYKQWVHTDRTTLISVEHEVYEFIDLVVRSYDALRNHHYIMKSQSAYLRELKDSLGTHKAVVLLDFAENYSFLVQDAVQGHHWDNSQATIHPFVIYYKQNGELKCHNIAVISDYLKHDTVTVHCFIAKLIPDLKQIIPGLEKIKYFSDGAASQYKNYKNFVNLCFHEQDFCISAEWHFFATSHGKSPCDGIGGTVKRLVARASLQAIVDHHILTPNEMYEWSHKNIEGIKFYYVSAEDIKENEILYNLEKRFHDAKTICGTRSHHSFIPISQYQLHMKRISQDTLFTLVNTRPQEDVAGASTSHYSTYQPGRYLACVYDNVWYVGYITMRSEEHFDVEVEFMNRKDKTVSWPVDTRRERSWVPFQDVICLIEAPLLQGRSGRTYKIGEADYIKILSLLPNFPSLS